jgi:hypothetical protein
MVPCNSSAKPSLGTISLLPAGSYWGSRYSWALSFKVSCHLATSRAHFKLRFAAQPAAASGSPPLIKPLAGGRDLFKVWTHRHWGPYYQQSRPAAGIAPRGHGYCAYVERQKLPYYCFISSCFNEFSDMNRTGEPTDYRRESIEPTSKRYEVAKLFDCKYKLKYFIIWPVLTCCTAT